jgi:hypothetical protein
MAARQPHGERGGEESPAAHSRLADDAARTQQHQREGGGRRGDRESQKDDEEIRQRPAGGTEQRRELAAPEVSTKQVRTQECDQQAQRHVERPGLRQRQQDSDPRSGLQDSGLLDRQQRLADERVGVPEW